MPSIPLLSTLVALLSTLVQSERVEAQPAYACFTIELESSDQPHTLCFPDCERRRHRGAAQLGALTPITSLSKCTPAVGSVWCYVASAVESCFPDRQSCETGNVDHPCREKRVAPPQTTASVDPVTSTPPVVVAETRPVVERTPARRRDLLVYGSLLLTGEKPDNSTGGALGIEHRATGDSSLTYAYGIDGVGHYSSGDRGFGGRIAARLGIGGAWGTGSVGLTAGIAYGGIERSAAEIPFEVFVNGSVFGLGVLLRYEQVHRFVDADPMIDNSDRFLNASGFSAWVVLWGGSLDPRASVGVRVQERDGADAAFFNVAVGLPRPF